MDSIATPTSISRVDSRYRHRAQDVPAHRRSASNPAQEEEATSRRASDAEPRGRDSMSRHHRFFHRRAAQNTRVVTVAVEVVATVDTNGVLVAKETMAPVTPQASSAPTGTAVAAAAAATASVGSAQQVLPSAVLSAASLSVVPPMPSVSPVVFPSVPSVPPLPSDLTVPTVPAYPFSSGASVSQIVSSSESVGASPVPTSAPQSTATTSAAPVPASVSAISSLALANSTISSKYLSLGPRTTSNNLQAPHRCCHHLHSFLSPASRRQRRLRLRQT